MPAEKYIESISFRYQDLATKFTKIEAIPTPFSPRLSRIQVGNEFLPAIVMRGSLLGDLSPQDSEYYRQAIGQILGDSDWQQKLKDCEGFSAENTTAGWGHGFEAQVMGDAMILITKIPTIRFIAECLSEQHGRPYIIKQTAHGAVQHQQNVVAEITNANLVHDFFKDHIRVKLASLGLGLAGLDGKNQDTRQLETLSKNMTLFKQLLNIAYWLNWRVFDRRMVEALDIFREKMNISAGYTANPATTRSLRDGNPGRHNRIINHVVDVGYSRDASGKRVAAQLLEFVNRGPIGVPDSTTADILARYYGYHDSFIVGENVGQVVDKRQVLQKWSATKNRRIILGSTSGHGANLRELEEMVTDFLSYRKDHQKSPYTCILFTGDHEDTGINSRMPKFIQTIKSHGAIEITASWNTPIEEFQKQVLSHLGELILVRTEDTQLTSIIKLWLQQIVHVEAVKPGEAHFMNPSVATVSYLLTPAPPNEPLNGIMALLKGGSIARSQKWSDYVKGYFKHLGHSEAQIDEALRSVPGISPQPNNIFDALDEFWGDKSNERETGRNVIKEQALKGFVEINNATVPLLVMVIASALGKSLTQEEYGTFVKENIASYLAMEKENKRALIRELFPKDFQKIFLDQVASRETNNNHKLLRSLIFSIITFICGYIINEMKHLQQSHPSSRP